MYKEQIDMVMFVLETLTDLSKNQGTEEEKSLKYQAAAFMLVRLAKAISSEAARVNALQQLNN